MTLVKKHTSSNSEGWKKSHLSAVNIFSIFDPVLSLKVFYREKCDLDQNPCFT